MKNMNVTINFSLPVTLFVVFLVLKLTHLIDWSWIWVIAPLWIGFIIFILMILIIAIIGLIRIYRLEKK